ncbi:hypothetical protein ACWCRC_39930 [Streptomyces sp. NPDC001940]
MARSASITNEIDTPPTIAPTAKNSVPKAMTPNVIHQPALRRPRT